MPLIEDALGINLSFYSICSCSRNYHGTRGAACAPVFQPLYSLWVHDVKIIIIRSMAALPMRSRIGVAADSSVPVRSQRSSPSPAAETLPVAG